MGLLEEFGEILSYEQSKKIQKKLQLLAAEQFLHVYQTYKEWRKDPDCLGEIMWGDEIEGHRLTYDQINNKLELSLKPLPKTMSFPLMIQYGQWMFEMIPSTPYKTKYDFEKTVESLRSRYKELQMSQDIYLSISCIPFIGVISEEKSKSPTFQNSLTQSRFIQDYLINDHTRYIALTRLIRERKGKTVDMRVPIFKDKFTNLQNPSYLQPYPGYIYMDAMAFGMGVACLQCTFSTKNIDHARYLHDSLHILSPLFLALTASTPIIKGQLTDWDVRWNILTQGVDDRTDQQNDSNNCQYQAKSRYSSISHYISNSPMNKPQYNDLHVTINKDVSDHIKKIVKQKGLQIDDRMINHLAILLSRQFLIVHQKFNQMTEKQNSLFQMINSTNWNSVRFKIPTDENIGWRVEFRTMEVQLTADQNAAFDILVFIIVLMMHHVTNLNFYIPLSKVEQNFQRAHKRNAITGQKFFFRINIREFGQPIIKQMSLDEILFGSKQNQFVGLLPLFIQFFQHPMIQPKKKQELMPTYKILKSLWRFLKMKVTGKIMTFAQWMRKFVISHQSYKQDSVVSEPIWTDMLLTLNKISRGEHKDQTFGNTVFQF